MEKAGARVLNQLPSRVALTVGPQGPPAEPKTQPPQPQTRLGFHLEQMTCSSGLGDSVRTIGLASSIECSHLPSITA